jgi:hypothetical protein
VLIALVSVLAAPPSLRADSISVQGITYSPVQIDRIESGKIYYRLGGDTKSRPADDLITMSLDDEPEFSAAESAYQQGQWDTAADGFARVLTITSRDWLKDWIAPRLLDSAGRSNRFDKAILGWIRLANLDPDAAAKRRPTLPTDSRQLSAAAQSLDTASRTAKDESRRLMLGMLLDVQTARKDSAASAAVAKLLEANDSLAPPGAAAAPIRSAEQDTRISLAAAAMSNKQYDQVISLIDSSAGTFTDPGRQSDALFLKAQAMEAKADGAATIATWQDVALAYLRVYVHFRDGPGSNHAPAALMHAAQIEETRLHESPAARTLYQKVVNEYKLSNEARQAAIELNSLAG